MRYFYTDRTVYRTNDAGEWHLIEANIKGEWREVTPSEGTLDHMRPITEAQAAELIATPSAERAHPSPR